MLMVLSSRKPGRGITKRSGRVPLVSKVKKKQRFDNDWFKFPPKARQLIKVTIFQLYGHSLVWSDNHFLSALDKDPAKREAQPPVTGVSVHGLACVWQCEMLHLRDTMLPPVSAHTQRERERNRHGDSLLKLNENHQTPIA